MKNYPLCKARAMMTFALGISFLFGSCDEKDPVKGPDSPDPALTLTNQFQYCEDDITDIKSAIYVVNEDGSHTFFLSPTEDLINVGQMEKANDYLRLMVNNPKGEVNTATETFEIEYKDISVRKTTMEDVALVRLSADLVTESRLNLYMHVELKSGKTLIARYQDTCTEERDVALKNMYEIDNEISSIGSVVEWRNVREGYRSVYLYENEGLTTPDEDGTSKGIEIQIADEMFDAAEDGSEIDLAKADQSDVRIRCGEFETDDETTGTLSLKYKTDKFGTNIEGLAVTLDVSKEGRRLRAAYDGEFAAGFKSGNTVKVSGTGIDEEEEAPISALFQVVNPMGYVFAFGDAETVENPSTDLHNGHWGIYLRLLADKFGGVINVEEQTGYYLFQLYDYETYQTYDSSEDDGLTGTIETYSNPVERKKIYLRVNLTLKNGIKVEAEYYGEPVTAEEADMSPEALKPVKPFEPYIQIRDESGKEPGKGNAKWVDKILSRMEVRLEKNFRWQGADIYDAYYFYFCPEGATTQSVEDNNNYPQLMLPASLVEEEGSDDYDLTKFDNSSSHWLFKYNVSPDCLSRGTNGYGDTYEQYGMKMRQCPNVANVTVKRNEQDKTWQVKLEILDFGKINGYANDNEVGTGNTLTIEFRGKATKYSGSKQNDLDESYYE